jgi:hypothetical protein
MKHDSPKVTIDKQPWGSFVAFDLCRTFFIVRDIGKVILNARQATRRWNLKRNQKIIFTGERGVVRVIFSKSDTCCLGNSESLEIKGPGNFYLKDASWHGSSCIYFLFEDSLF